MAGYLMSLDSEESLKDIIKDGVYAARMALPKKKKWAMSQEGIFADFSSMKNGDNIYFFYKRKIYGVGELTNIEGDCKYFNFPDAGIPQISSSPTQTDFLYLFQKTNFKKLDSTQKKGLTYEKYIQQYRFVCFFKPAPFYFENGIDMDDMLTSEPPSFKILRDFYQKSFIKIDDVENQAFKNIILRRNFDGSFSTATKIYSNYPTTHSVIASKVKSLNYKLDVSPFLSTTNKGKIITHEMAIEAALVSYLSSRKSNVTALFSEWDYLSHQVVASPPKPSMYLDRIDIFGYSYISGQYPTKSKYLIIEVKKETVIKDDLFQLMKYVDFIKDEYAYNDYSMIDAFLVGHGFDADCIASLKEVVTRNYIHGIRPATAKIWKNVKLIKYSYNSTTKELDFDLIQNANLL